VVQRIGGSESTWQVWDFPSTKTRAYVFRGTATLFDAMADMGIYSMSSSVQAVSMFLLPLTKILPTDVVLDLVDILTNDDFKVTMHMEALDDARQWQMSHPKGDGWSAVVLGHSLGGVYANLLGASLQIPTFTFSPPGILQISRNAGVEHLELSKSFLTSLVPKGDPVPLMDKQVGTRVEFPCTVPVNYFTDVAGCHKAERTLAMLVLACPDWNYPERQWGIGKSLPSGETARDWYLGGPSDDLVLTPKGWPKRKPKPTL